jgi:manganese transport protein
VAYVDPGNFAVNFSAGAQYGYALLWVLIAANLMAVLVQYLSAKVGLVTGMSLPEVIAAKLGRKSRIAYWLQAELVAVSTDIAEVIGGAIALHILFGLPLLAGAVITGIVSMILLLIYSSRGQKLFERVIVGLLLIIPIGFVAGLIMQPPHASDVVAGLVPRIDSPDMLLLAVGMLGATVMPHVVYLHSAMTRDRHGKKQGFELGRLLRATKIDVGLAMVLAGTVNICMLLLAAGALHGVPGTDTLQGIYEALNKHVSVLIGTLFGLSLLVSGFASTAVGSYAGAAIMEGMLRRRVPLYLRRLLTIIPAIIIVALGVDPSFALILSQVALSFGIPFALVPLLLVTANRRIMGQQVNSPLITGILAAITAVIIVLNVVLIGLTIAG